MKESALDAFMSGWASIFDPYAGSVDVPGKFGGLEQDYQAISGDWQAVGRDMWGAFNVITSEAAHAK